MNKGSKRYGLLLLLLLSGCTLLQRRADPSSEHVQVFHMQDAAKGHTGDKTDGAEVQGIQSELRRFFREHPEYVRSREKNESLYIQFLYIINTPQYRNLSMYDALKLAYQKAQINE
ncbi:TPA: hypothetical protein RU610_004512 [Salmonella enterica]|nr:hypothetical protein [Salmonella enterica subsp. diarizonae]HEA0263526.1 hypothetical protein [Salmonella enterica]HEA0268621.1 hypothetical protein [Salmonella enterica]HEA0295558.1 hypothetical protein [Salmonella enterica]HEA0304667.1 hypothetical protein [Salmonella enterica]